MMIQLCVANSSYLDPDVPRGKEEKGYFPHHPWTPNRQFCFLSRRLFRYYLSIASHGTIFAAKWSIIGRIEALVSM